MKESSEKSSGIIHMSTPPSSPCFVTVIDLSLADKLLQGLKNQGFELSTPPHTIFSGKKKGISCTLYQSGKLTVQGKDKNEFIQFYLEPEILGTFKFGYEALDIDPTPRIGVDESGKGDFFGPLCIAGVYASGEDVTKLHSLGVRDSKALSDTTILKIAKEIRSHYVHHVVRIGPEKYNELYAKFKNLNHLLAWGHATVIENLAQKSGCNHATIDQFAAEHVVETALKRKGLSIDLKQRHRGEEDLVVAAASILAREAFLDGLEKLEKEFEIPLPKGASQATVKAGKALVAKYGSGVLSKTSKTHFKTSNIVLEQNLPLENH
jgi:ribonuclease HIII